MPSPRLHRNSQRNVENRAGAGGRANQLLGNCPLNNSTTRHTYVQTGTKSSTSEGYEINERRFKGGFTLMAYKLLTAEVKCDRVQSLDEPGCVSWISGRTESAATSMSSVSLRGMFPCDQLIAVLVNVLRQSSLLDANIKLSFSSNPSASNCVRMDPELWLNASQISEICVDEHVFF
ncbi:hypothetical protein EVAR_2221_1 [Eumeta japonica]|uniref:Uncharacterized protein n=1 Tax=Eumeta variegata TaxID=151549 RepID=A0A4C1SFV8_EUMVA|nr:hypothetical protein EVAR_2221_1 [Eumeta japonica]